MILSNENELSALLNGKSAQTLVLFHHFISRFSEIGELNVEPTKTMIGISNAKKRIAWVPQLGKNFVHVVFPFRQEYADNQCFQKIAKVPGQQQFNHHLRLLDMSDINDEVLRFMKIAYLDQS